MKAIIREKYGPAEDLKIKEIDTPIPSANEVLVKVYSTTVNRTDCSILTGLPFIMRFFIGLRRPRRPITGSDFAGQIVQLGENVTSFKLGDRVIGLNDEGLSSHAEYLTIAHNEAIISIPSFIDYHKAAASIEGAHYAINFLNKIELKKGDKVLVNGATGAIGSAAIQFLLLKGVNLTAVCNTKNISLIKSLGVKKVIDYEKEDFTQLKDKFQFVLDAVGKSRFKYCKKILTSDGVYVSSELGPRAENVFLSLFKRNKNKKRVIFPIPNDRRSSLIFIATLLERKEFEPLIDRIYPFEDITEAFRYVQTGNKTGNVILKITD